MKTSTNVVNRGSETDRAGRRGRCCSGGYKRAARWVIRVALALCLQWLAPAAVAQTLSQTELQRLLASDGAAGSEFGHAVALSGDRVLVGARSDLDTGSAYVFELDDEGDWYEVAKLIGPDAGSYEFFGTSVALSGDRALVGALRPGDINENGEFVDMSSAHVFERDEEGVWNEVAKLTASDAILGTHFGRSVALSGDRALVGDDGNRGGGQFAGSAYVFERGEDGVWNEVARLTASDAALLDSFGASVAFSGDRALVGAYRGDDGSVIDAGSAYVFERDEDGVWNEMAKLTASDAALNDFFGISVAVSGELALVGSSSDDGDNSGEGSAYVFERNEDGVWLEVAKLTASDLVLPSTFGGSVALLDNRALVGAQHSSHGGAMFTGSAHVFERGEDGVWEEVATLIAPDGVSSDGFGVSVALSDDRALIGTRFGGPGDVGSAYLSDVTGLSDVDEDGILDAVDNCPADVNPLQEDFDEDMLGDVCDLDDDNDGVVDTADVFPLDSERAVECTPGSFGAFSCELAPAGFFVADSGALEAIACPVGRFSALPGAAFCIDAAPGTFVDQPGQSLAMLCPVGQFSAEPGATFCTEALPGTFVDQPGQSLAMPCPAGQFSAEPGAIVCSEAAPGTFVDQPGQSLATPCPVGQFSALPGAAFCTNATPGTFVDQPGQSMAMPCPVGQFSTRPGAAFCTNAAPGTFVDQPGQSQATLCPVGSFAAIAGSTVCTQASPGFYVPEPGADQQNECQIGTFSAVNGASECETAAIGTFVSETGAIEAQSCPAGTTTLAPGASSHADCVDIAVDPQPATLFQHVNFQGHSLGVDEGEVTISDLRASTVGNDVISSIDIAPGYEVLACRHSRLRGRCVVFSSSVSDLRDIRFNDTISSLVVRPLIMRPVTLYQHVSFRGNTFSVDEGHVSILDLSASAVGNDVISSIEIAPGYEVYACQHRRLRGRCETFADSVSDLRDIGFNDTISSLVVRPVIVRPVTVYQHVSFGGNTFSVGEGYVSIRDLRASGVGNDVISSIEIALGYEVYACQHSRLRGRCETFTESMLDLRDIGFNDVVSSLRVRRAP